MFSSKSHIENTSSNMSDASKDRDTLEIISNNNVRDRLDSISRGPLGGKLSGNEDGKKKGMPKPMIKIKSKSNAALKAVLR